ncbi:MAG: DUF115 domain-containing protein [Methylophilaceae bacterium]|nr:DUF115 domain-containing protein [Methylophilaceae bacterium]
MTPLQQAYLTKLHATAAANLEFFKLNMPQIYARVTEASPLPSLDISDQGDLTLRYPDGTTRPVAPYYVEQEARFAEFARPTSRPRILAFHNLRYVSEHPTHGDMQRYHYSNIDAEFPNRARRHFVQHYPDNTGLLRYPAFGSDKTIPLLIVLGSGLGGHLDRLVLEYDVGYLVVMDTDEDAFRVSLFFQDYVRLSRLAMEKGTDLAFIIGPNIEHMIRGFMGVLRKTLPPFFVHGAALFYAMPEGETLEAIKESITQTLWQVYFGLGYFDDELISIRHTFQNLARRRPIYSRPRVIEDAGPVAFIIGSGPSLDGLLPLLEQYRDKAVLISCGTALGPLAHAGIVPDFHCEKERPGIVYDVLTRTVPADFLRKVHLIGLNVVMPEVFDLFGAGSMVMKDSDTMSLLLASMKLVPKVPIDSQPTVTNMALSLALGLGFRRIYLFGVDLGYRDPERHHARHTAYLGKLPTEEGELRRLLSKRPGNDRPAPANFGGEAYANGILELARIYMEATLRVCPHATVYNLNDGVRIEGTLPLRPEEFPDLSDATDKSAVIRRIHTAFSSFEVQPAQVADALLTEVDTFIDRVRELVSRPYRTFADVLKGLIEIYGVLHALKSEGDAGECLFRGTVLNLLSLTYNAISLIADADEAVAKVRYDFYNLLDALEAAREEVVNNLPPRGA